MCGTELYEQGSPNARCATKVKRDVIAEAIKEYAKPEIYEFARQASIQEFECYMQFPDGTVLKNPRVEETVQFAKKMGYKRIGVAYCVGLRNEAITFTTILENRGFSVSSACCKLGGTQKEVIGIKEEEKIAGAGNWETMCNPIAQAYVLNDEKTDLNVLVGLCVGHDSLFLKYSEAPSTVLLTKDRVLGHNAAAGLYLSTSYYGKVMRKE
jgi:uncharacterized metal-binding protein